MEPHFHRVKVTWNKDRQGIMGSPDLEKMNDSGQSCIEVATPPQFPKCVPGIWSPEHLFTAAVSSCFMTTFLSIAENSKLNYLSFICSASGKLEQEAGKYKMTEVMIEPVLTILNEKGRGRAMRVLEEAESSCLITNSINSKVIMKPIIELPAYQNKE